MVPQPRSHAAGVCVREGEGVAALVEGAWADCTVTHSAAYDASRGERKKQMAEAQVRAETRRKEVDN